MPSRIALHPGNPWVKPCASKSDCFRYTLFDGPASAGGLGRRASSGSWLRSRRSPMGRTTATWRCPGQSHGQTGMLTISSGLVHLSGTGLLLIVRAVVASPFEIKMYSLDFTVRMVLSHQAQLCPGSARWWRAQSSKQWSSILVVSAFGS